MKQISFCVIDIKHRSIMNVLSVEKPYIKRCERIIKYTTVQWLKTKKNNKRIYAHRINEPAYIIMRDNHITQKIWYNYSSLHRIFGPAHIAYRSNGYLNAKSWFLKGKDITNDVEKWLKEGNIKLFKKNNYEIPDEYKAEFKMRFL